MTRDALRALAWSQWRWSRVVLAVAIAAVGVTALSQLHPISAYRGALDLRDWMLRSRSFSPLWQSSAALTGILLAIGTWSPDARGRFAYVAYLPIRRTEYTIARYVMGTVLLLVPAMALLLFAWVGCLLSAPPPLLRVYAGGMAGRWFLGAIDTFGLTYGLLTISRRFLLRAVICVLTLLVIDAGYSLVVDHAHVPTAFRIADWIFGTTGPYSPFFDDWLLVDV